MSIIKVIIADDHKLFRNGLKFILSEMENIEVIADVSNGKELLEFLQIVKPDIVLLDINMPEMNGIEATKKALELYPELKILILTMYGDEQYYNTMIDLGVKGFVLKDTDNTELKNAIHSIVNNNSYFSQELLLRLIRNKKTNDDIKLTRREREVLAMICKGLGNGEISAQLNLSQRTVERHRASLLSKTSTHNSIAMVIYAIKNNLVEI
jgi:DNA-binding NarL/FixJ family response regulator